MFKYAIMQYTPQRYMRKADLETQDTMRHLLDFKAGRKYATKWAAQIVGKTLSAMDLTNTVIVCIPASSSTGEAAKPSGEQTNKRRYKRFSADVCATCATANAFIEQMQAAGADVRMTLFLAKTKTYHRFEHPRQTGKRHKPKGKTP